MPDFGAPVAQGVQVPSITSSLGGLMNLKLQQQSLQSGALGIQQQQQNLQKSAAETQATQQTTQQRASIAKVDWSKYDDGTGTVSTDKMLGDPDLRKAAGDSFLDVVKQGAAVRSMQLQNKQTLTNLTGSQLGAFGSTIGGLKADPDVIADNPTGRQKVTDAITQFGQAYGPEAAKVAQIYAPIAQHAPPGKLANGINAIQLQAMDASRQASAQAPSYASTGDKLTNVNPQAAGGNLSGSPDIATGTPPGAHTFQDQAGNTWAFNPQNPGQAQLVGKGGGGAPPSGVQGGTLSEQTPAVQASVRSNVDPKGPPPTFNGAPFDANQRPAPPTMGVGEADQVKANTQTVTANRQQAQDAQTQHDILGRIQALASTPGLYLGPGSKSVADLATAVSQIPGFEGAAKYANNYNELTKFMAQNAARQGQSMGLSGSDARLDMATHSQPNADPMDARTVRSVAQFMGGIVRMNLAKADAMDKWLAQPGNSLQNEHQFERTWRDNADPRLFQLAEMKDQGEATNYAKLHIKPSEQKALGQKHDVLQQLGALP